MNCYDSPNSLGNPVLLDKQFRQAVNWAVDREKVVSIAMNGYAEVGSTLVVPYSQYHWEPPADSAFTYDPAKANELLDAAGYTDVNGDGFRETKDGAELSLRFYAPNDSPQYQTAGKLIVGWLKDVGIKLRFEVVDTAVLIDAQYNYKGDTYAPDWDMFIGAWVTEPPPQTLLASYTPQQIENWNDCCWTDPEYTKLSAQMLQTIDPSALKPITDQMQQVFYEAAPYAMLVYPEKLVAWNSADWQGWTSGPDGETRPQEYITLYDWWNVDTYRFVEPKTAASADSTSASNSTPIIVIAIAIALVAVVLGGVVLVRRRGGRSETE